jgi:DHA1 family bicyclomycin/chloramphenicol resistance-like MFS transporter
VRIPPASVAFTLLMGFLVALPSFGIDMSLPALTATGASLHIAPAGVPRDFYSGAIGLPGRFT